MSEFVALKTSVGENWVRKAILNIERIVDKWGRFADTEFDEDAAVGKSQECIPVHIWDFIAQQAGGTKCYQEFAFCIESIDGPQDSNVEMRERFRIAEARRRRNRRRRPGCIWKGVF